MKTTSNSTKDWQEIRRLRAWELWQAGWKQDEIAEALGVSQGAVSQWIKRAREEGEQALRRRTTPGPKPRLTRDQWAQLTQMLARGATAYGFVEDLWTPRRVAEVIRREYGVSYHPDHVRRILNAWGWTQGKMVQRAAAK